MSDVDVADPAAGDPNADTPGNASGFGRFRDRPFGLLALGFTVGAVVGVVAPVTAFERTRLGPIGEAFAARVKRIAADIVVHGRALFDDTLAAASASAAKQGQAIAEEIQREFRSSPPA